MERPIIFSGPMIGALLDGRKTQTRRIIKPQPPADRIVWINDHWLWTNGDGDSGAALVPYTPGDRLWVREAHSLHHAHGQNFKRPADDHGERWGPWSGLPIAVSPDKTQVAYYREGFDRSGAPKWRPSIHMPRWASRLTLIVTDVRVQRLQDISEADAEAEGATSRPGAWRRPDWSMDWSEIGRWSRNMGRKLTQADIALGSARWAFASFWNDLRGLDAWDANPWVAALTFTVHRCNIDQVGAGE